MGYQPIENYGVIGNMRTVALVGMNGSIDWFCCPNFDSPSVFAAILDDKKGGHFSIAPAVAGVTHKQIYWPETNVLVTRFLSADGVAEVIDFMPVGAHQDRHGHSEIIRRVNVVRGTMHFRMECFPAFNYARDEHEILLNECGAEFRSPGISLQLSTALPLERNCGCGEALGSALVTAPDLVPAETRRRLELLLRRQRGAVEGAAS